jgi:MFS family permease
VGVTELGLRPDTAGTGGRRFHPAWAVAAATFLALVGAAAFRATPGVLIDPLRAEFGWSVGTISLAIAINMALFGLTAPFAAALMERFGVRRVVVAALVVVAAGSGLTVFMTAAWQLVLCWGVLVGLGTGSMALSLVATVTGRWFTARRGLVSGVLTAGSATGQLVFLPVVAVVSERYGWRPAALGVAAAALAVVPFVLWRLRDRPSDLGVLPYGGAPESAGLSATASSGAAGSGGATASRGATASGGAAALALRTLVSAARVGPFWLLVGGFMICGATTMGLLQPHFVPAAHDHGMPTTVAAGLLAVVGLFDLVGTVLSGWLTDRFDPRVLLCVYYVGRGLSLMLLPALWGPVPGASMLSFIVFYGLDWVATVPPTLALCRRYFGDSAPVVFGWVYASHQVGAAIMAFAAGLLRDHLGSYDSAWYLGGGLCLVAAALSAGLRARPAPASTARGTSSAR